MIASLEQITLIQKRYTDTNQAINDLELKLNELRDQKLRLRFIIHKYYNVKESKESFESIMNYWINKKPDNAFCVNCSYYFINNLCPCKLNHIIDELISNDILRINEVRSL